MKIYAVSMGVLLLMACGASVRESLSPRQAGDLLISPARAFMRDWTLVQIYDPYQDGTVIKGDSAQPQHLIFFRDGHFLSYDRWNYSDGTWLVHADKQRLALVYAIQNGRRLPPEKQDTTYRYHLLRPASGDTLVLGIQGRHGIVRETYCPAQ